MVVSDPDPVRPDVVQLVLHTGLDQRPWLVGALDSAPAAIAVLDGPDHRWIYGNDTFHRLTGGRPVLGLTFRESLPELVDGSRLLGILDEVGRTGEPYAATDARMDFDRDGDGQVEEGYFTVSLSPVTDADGRARGVLVVAVETTSEVLTRRSAERRAAREQVLLRIVTASTTMLAAEAKLSALAGAAVPVLADACVVHVLDRPMRGGRAPRLPVVTHCSVVAVRDDARSRVLPEGRTVRWPGDDPVTAAIAAGRPVLSSSRGGPPWAAEAGLVDLITVLDLHGVAAVPVLADGLVRAVIVFAGAAARPPYADDDLELLRLIADHAAVAVHQGRRYEHVRDSSLALQHALMTEPPPQVNDVEICVRYRPAAIDAAVGGDWYDAFLLPGGDLACVVGDVAGHDVDAAAVMGQLRSMLRAFAYHLDAPPSVVLDALNRVLIGMRIATLTTGIYARLSAGPDGDGDERSHTVTWSNAGHPPPLVIHPNADVDVLDGHSGGALGFVLDTPRGDGRITLEDGATLLLYTDGLIERRGEDLDECLARLVRRATAMAGRPLGQLCDDLLADAPGDDDTALIALRSRR